MWRVGGKRWQPSVADDDLASTVRAGNVATLIASLGVVGFATYALPPTGRRADVIVALVVIAGLGVVVTNGLAADDVRVRRWAAPTFVVWSVADVVLIAVAVGATGGWQSPLLWLLVLPITFFTVLLDRRTAALLFGLVVAVPFVVGALTGMFPPADQSIVFLAVLAATAMLTSHLATILRERITDARRAAGMAERRAQLLSATARATRSLAGLEVSSVACNLVEATATMGFGAVAMFDVDDEHGQLTCTAQVGLSDDWVGRSLELADTVAGQVVVRGEAVAVVDRSDPMDAMHEFRSAGFRAVVAVPVKRGERVTAVLVVGSRRERALMDDEIEAIETLAIHANIALEMAAAFESEANARRNLEALVQLQRDQAATLSHELRTPLTVIQGAGQLLRSRWDDLSEHDRRGLVDRLAWHTRDLTRLVDRLHRLELLERGDQSVHPRPVLLEPLISTLTRTFSDNVDGHLLTSRAHRGIRALADPALLELALIELVDNAVRHTPPGSHVHVDAALVGGRIEVVVTDDGPGIPADELDDVLLAFRRAGDLDTRPTRGLGIGLALVRHVLELHEAVPDIRSDDGGLTVLFSLPLNGVDEQAQSDHVLLLGDLIASRRPLPAGSRRS